MIIGKEFITILYTDICNDISKAFNSLTNETYQMDSDTACETVDDFANEMEKVIVCYIEQQKRTFHKIKVEQGKLSDAEQVKESSNIDEVAEKVGQEIVNKLNSMNTKTNETDIQTIYKEIGALLDLKTSASKERCAKVVENILKELKENRVTIHEAEDIFHDVHVLLTRKARL